MDRAATTPARLQSASRQRVTRRVASNARRVIALSYRDCLRTTAIHLRKDDLRDCLRQTPGHLLPQCRRDGVPREGRIRCNVPVWETSSREERYTVRKPVWETSYRDCSYTVQKPVWETSERECRRTVRRPVVETSERECRKTVMRRVVETVNQERCRTVYKPVTTMRTVRKDCGHWVAQPVCRPGYALSGFREYDGSLLPAEEEACLETRPRVGRRVVACVCPNVVEQQIPCTTYVAQVVRESCPVQVCRYVPEVGCDEGSRPHLQVGLRRSRDQGSGSHVPHGVRNDHEEGALSGPANGFVKKKFARFPSARVVW